MLSGRMILAELLPNHGEKRVTPNRLCQLNSRPQDGDVSRSFENILTAYETRVNGSDIGKSLVRIEAG